MNEEKEFCQICCEIFDKSNKLPKLMPCCRNIICLKCLKDIYENQFLSQCPICRCSNKIIPNQLKSDMTIFEGFFCCPSCNQTAVKSELYYSFDTGKIKCIKCQLNEMSLLEYVTMMSDDLFLFLKDYPVISNTCLLDLLTIRIQLKLDAFFNSLKKELINQFRTKIAEEIKSKIGFDLQKNVMQFKDNIDKLNGYLNNMKTFLNESGVKTVTIPKLMSNLKNYLLSKEEVIDQSFPFDRIKKYINESHLFTLRKEINENEIKNFMVNIFTTDLNDNPEDSYLTGIKYYDNYFSQFCNPNMKSEKQEKEMKQLPNNQFNQFDLNKPFTTPKQPPNELFDLLENEITYDKLDTQLNQEKNNYQEMTDININQESSEIETLFNLEEILNKFNKTK